ncbi:MAG: Omp28-related outer membrane protein [Bacteroidales bacterium]|nr:Omp28-related outer membrane protein [Candidatus Liminaster caballi]
MKKLFLMLAMALAVAVPAVAQQTASLWWGYGDGQSIWKGVGGGTNASTQTAAIKVPADVVASYAGSRIKSIRFAVTSNTGSATDVSYFLTTDVMAIADDERTTVGTLYKGWHTFQLATPYEIVAGQDLYIGYTATGSRPVAIVDEPGCEGSCWMGSGKKIYDYGVMEGYKYTLGIQVLIEADDFEAGLSFAEAGDVKAETTGGVIPITMRSISPVAVSNYTISYSVDGQSVGSVKANCNLKEIGDTHSVELPLPTLELGSHVYEVEVTAINGKAVTAGVKAQGNLEILKYVMYRKHVIEECTGTWCGYCVRGLVAMREMRKNHPDRFIGIAVHGRDSYATSSYATLLGRISGYPSAFFNRSRIVGTEPSEMEVAFQNAAELTDCEIKIDGVEYTNSSRNTVDVHMRYRSATNHNRIDYRVAIVTLEDYIGDSQANYYSGGGMGPMGGFENMGSYAWVELMDVARDITSYTGIINSVPADLEEGKWYEYTYRYTLPNTIRDRSNVSIVVLLQNANGSEILNADKTEKIYEPGEMGIESVSVAEPSTSVSYDIYGRRLDEGAEKPGFSIRNGKVIYTK